MDMVKHGSTGNRKVITFQKHLNKAYQNYKYGVLKATLIFPGH